MDEADTKLEALWRKSQAEWLKNRIADTCEDYGSTDGTLAGIKDAEARAQCEIEIKREQRDQARRIREHNEREGILRAARMQREQERKARHRDRRDDVGQKSKFEAEVSPRKIMERFNRRRTTG